MPPIFKKKQVFYGKNCIKIYLFRRELRRLRRRWRRYVETFLFPAAFYDGGLRDKRAFRTRARVYTRLYKKYSYRHR